MTGKSSAEEPAARRRLDKWLWFARFYRTRALAADAVQAGRIRVNGARTVKPGFALKVGDVLTFAKAGRVMVVEALALGERRGPAPEAQTLYKHLDDDDASAHRPTEDQRDADPETPRRLDASDSAP